MTTAEFNRLETRCNVLIDRYLQPAIDAENVAIATGDAVPSPNFDDFAAFRLLSHAELEGYFEAKARAAVQLIDADFKANKVQTAKCAALVYLHAWKNRSISPWPTPLNDDPTAKASDLAHCKMLAQQALGFGRDFIKSNNGIKEASIHVLSALMGHFPDQLDSVLVGELNQYGRNRGDVAHESWTMNTRTFDSAEIEKNRLLRILTLTKEFYEA